MKNAPLLLLVALAAAGCDPETKTTLPPKPDAGERFDQGFQPRMDAATPRRDAEVDLDVSVEDMGPMVDGAMGDADAADAIIDAEPVDMGPAGGPPPRSRAVVLSGSNDAWVAWARGGRLLARRLPDGGEPGPVIDVAEAVDLSGPLLGSRTRSGPPWVLLPDPLTRELHAHDLEAPEADPVPMGVWGPARLLNVGAQTVIMGADGPKADARTIVRVFDDLGRGRTLPDGRGLPAAASLTPALGRLVAGFDVGVCATLDTGALDDAVGLPWRCHARPGAVSVGAGEALYFVGAVAERVVMWRGMPGAAVDPTADGADVTVLVNQPATVEALHTLADNRVLINTVGLDHDTLWLLEDDAVRSVDLSAVGDAVLGVATFRRRVLRVDWNEGQPVMIEVPPADGPAPPLYTKPEGCNISINPEDCSPNDQDCDGLTQGALCCADGAVHTRVPLPDGVLPARGWRVLTSDAGLIFVVPTGDAVRMYVRQPGDTTRPVLGQSIPTVGQWLATGELRHVANRRVRTVMHVARAPGPMPPGEDAGVADMGPEDAGADAGEAGDAGDAALDMGVADAGEDMGTPDMGLPMLEHELLWFVDAETQGRTPAPCEPVALHVLDTDGRTRVFCADRAVDLDPLAEAGADLAYPVADRVRWIWTAPFGDDELVLAATGELHTLNVWRLTPDGFTVEQPFLGGDVEAMSAADRALPFRPPLMPGQRPARVVDEAELEVYVAGRGWRPVPTTPWPLEARLLHHAPLAISVADTLPPDALEGRLAVFVHDMDATGTLWGRRFAPPGSATLSESVFWGLAVPEFDPGRGDISAPLVWRGVGTDPVDLEGFRSTCLTRPSAP
jgi:hypothetical protein